MRLKRSTRHVEGRVFIKDDCFREWLTVVAQEKISEEAKPVIRLDRMATPPDRLSSGYPGRPSKIAHLIEHKFLSRVQSGEAHQSGSLAVEARWLRDWAIRTHPEAPQPTVGTIENNLRERYNALVRGKPMKGPMK